LDTHILPFGHLLHQRYTILSAIGQGGFGITYWAYDQKLDQEVCIKELFVSGNSTRGANLTVHSQSTGDFFFADFVLVGIVVLGMYLYLNSGAVGDNGNPDGDKVGANTSMIVSPVPVSPLPIVYDEDTRDQPKPGNDAEVQRQKEEVPQKELERLREQERNTSNPIQKLLSDMVFVQGGTFTMGCTSEQGNDCFSYEKPSHQVTLSSFYINKYEVTQALWSAVMGSNPSYFSGCDQCPVENVSWNDAQEFIQKLNAATGKNYRLPTEAEWEYAARGGRNSRGYKYSGSNKSDKVGWYDDNSSNKTHPVGKKKPNELGLYDMTGNVWEWCSDWYGDYSSQSQTDPKGPSNGLHRVNRGNSWGDEWWYVRLSFRFDNRPENSFDNLGFRLASSE